MDPVRHILAIFGAIDRAVAESDDPELLGAADALLPGASANQNWYATLRDALPSTATLDEPDLVGAVQKIADGTQDENPLTQSQKVRLLYGLSTLARLSSVATKSELLSFTDPADTGFAAALETALSAIAPTGADADARTAAAASRQDFFTTVAGTFKTWRDFDGSVRQLATTSLRGGTPLAAPLCKTAIVTVEGKQCVLVDTAFESDDVCLEDLKKIVNPFNWDEDYSEFFENMDPQKPQILADGWRRVLEKVRLLEGFDLRTPLKFLPYEDSGRPYEASLEYDLDQSRFGTGDERVLVDRGYIRMAAKDRKDPRNNGVRVTTRKIVHITGIPPWAQARLVCLCGYGTSSADFLLKAAAARRTDPPPEPFLFPKSESQTDNDPTDAAAPAPIHYVPAAVGAWTEAVQDVTNSYLGLTEKWLSGGLTVTDMADHCRRVYGDLGSAPWKYLQDIMTPRSPGGTGGKK